MITGEDWNNYFKQQYGKNNVQWESAVKSMDDILDVPSNITKLKPEQLSELARKEGAPIGPHWVYGLKTIQKFGNYKILQGHTGSANV